MKIKEGLSFLGEILQLAILALVIVLPIRYFIFQPFVVKGASMEPNFHDGDYLIVDELSYRFQSPQRGEVIVFKNPNNESERYIKRIIGLPKEQVEIKNSKIVITNKVGESFVVEESSYLPSLGLNLLTETQSFILNDSQYFVMGDNRNHSSDSRSWGALERREIIGRALFRAWPLVDFGFLSKPDYQTN